MPKIAQAQPDQVPVRVIRQPRASADVPKGAFGGGDIARSLAGLAQAGKEAKGRVDTTAAKEALLGFEKAKNDVFFNPDSGYFNTQGRNAYDGAKGTSSALADLKRTYGDGLDVNARTMFDTAADAHIARADVDIMRHSAKGLQTWEIATSLAEVENSVENASLYWAQPQKMSTQRISGQLAVINGAEREGVGPEATAERVQTFNSTFSVAAVSAATANSAAEGQALLDKFNESKSLLEEPDRLQLEGLIAKQTKQEKVQADASFVLAKATAVVGRSDSKSDILAEMKKIDDPKLRKDTTAEAMSQLRLKGQAEKESQVSAWDAAVDVVAGTGSVTAFKAANPTEWGLLDKTQQKKLEQGEGVISDMTKFYDLMALPDDARAQLSPNDYLTVLAKAELKQLSKSINSARGGGSDSDKDEALLGRSISAQVKSKVGLLYGKPSARNEEEHRQADAFYGLADAAVKQARDAKGKPLTGEELNIVLGAVTRDVVDQGPSVFGFHPFESTDSIADIPAAEQKSLTRFLTDNGIPVNADNLLKAYEQAK